MHAPLLGGRPSLATRIERHVGQLQHRNAYYLILNTLTGAATGIVFWFLLARVAGLSPAQVGLGYAIVALGTTVGVVAKGGLDTAILRTVPGASRSEGARLLRLGFAIGGSAALALTFLIAALWYGLAAHPAMNALAWSLVGGIAVLLVCTWLQDAYFLAHGDARLSLKRNLVLSAARVALPLPIVALVLPQPVALTWVLALGLSAFAALGIAAHLGPRKGRLVPREEFLRTAARNATGNAAEFLPGLLLSPLVLLLDGSAAAAYFGIAWTAASLLFLVGAAISRSAMAEMVRHPSLDASPQLRRAALLQGAILVPGALLGAALAPRLLASFGPAYAREGGFALVALCASAPFVGAWLLYLALLRARERAQELIWVPAAMMGVLVACALVLGSRFAINGIAWAWLCATVPFGAYAAWRIHAEARGVSRHAKTESLDRHPHAE